MDRSLKPFEVGDKVIALETSKTNEYGISVKKGRTYTIQEIFRCRCGRWIVGLSELYYPEHGIDLMCCTPKATSYYGGPAKYFRKINPYQSSVSRSLAERAVESIGDGQDMKPLKVKEVF